MNSNFKLINWNQSGIKARTIQYKAVKSTIIINTRKV